MEHVSDKQQFCVVAPAAQSIFSYVAGAPALRKMKLEFEYAMIDEPSGRAVAKFSCVNCTDCMQAVVWVSALTQLDGSWSITHSIGSIS